MTADEMRAQVGDHPVALPAGMAACPSCGIATPDPDRPAPQPRLPLVAGDRVSPTAERWVRCASCEHAHADALAYVGDHPLLARRLGEGLATVHIEAVLLALNVLGQGVPTDVGVLLDRLGPPSDAIRWRSPLRETQGKCCPWPFAHLLPSQRGALRTAWAAHLADRVHPPTAPTPTACPTRGCLLCGLDNALRWRAVVVQPRALGRTGGEMVRGHVCPACSQAISASGAVGPSAMGRALLDFLDDEASTRLRALLTENDVHIPAWGAQPDAAGGSTRFAYLAPSLRRLRITDTEPAPATA